MEEIIRARQHAERLYSAEAVQQAIERMAQAISSDLADRNPVLLCVMNGGLIPMGCLLPHLEFPLRVDYIHATRYRERTFGTELEWKKYHEAPLQGETVLIVDDILDEGHTLQAIVEYCVAQDAKEVRTAVLAHKLHDRGADIQADYVGLTVPDRYVFGFGMDYKGYWRNAAGIFAI